MKLFTDGSVNPQQKVGYGAYLLVTDKNVVLESRIKTKRFEQTSSTKLELQTLLWALDDLLALDDIDHEVMIYTDSQNIIGLPRRRDGFEKNNYRTKANKCIANHELYREFYRVTDKLECEFIKVKGHKKSHQKDEIDRIFTLVDRASRLALREGALQCRS